MSKKSDLKIRCLSQKIVLTATYLIDVFFMFYVENFKFLGIQMR